MGNGEHDAVEIWERAQEVITGALKQANILGSDLAAIGLTNQRETTVVWDVTTGQPLSNAIVWQDTRTTDFLATLTQEQQMHALEQSMRGCSGTFRVAFAAEFTQLMSLMQVEPF